MFKVALTFAPALPTNNMVALAAFVPVTAAAILEALQQPGELSWENVAPGRTQPVDGIDAVPPLFPRLDAPAAA
jgi:hypothetical protein